MISRIVLLLESMSEIPINPIFTTMCLRKLAFFSSSTLGNDIYYLKEFVEIMINVIGENKLVDMLKTDNSNNKDVYNRIGENWNKINGIKKGLSNLDKVVESTKQSYDILEDKSLKDFKKLNYKNFIKRSSKIPMIKQDLYALFVFLVNSTTIKRMTIPADYFKIFESRNFKSISEFDKRKVGDPVRPKKEM